MDGMDGRRVKKFLGLVWSSLGHGLDLDTSMLEGWGGRARARERERRERQRETIEWPKLLWLLLYPSKPSSKWMINLRCS